MCIQHYATGLIAYFIIHMVIRAENRALRGLEQKELGDFQQKMDMFNKKTVIFNQKNGYDHMVEFKQC